MTDRKIKLLRRIGTFKNVMFTSVLQSPVPEESSKAAEPSGQPSETMGQGEKAGEGQLEETSKTTPTETVENKGGRGEGEGHTG